MKKSTKKTENAVVAENVVVAPEAENVPAENVPAENVPAENVVVAAENVAPDNNLEEMEKRFIRADFSHLSAETIAALETVRASTILQNIHGKRIDTDFAVMDAIVDIFAKYDISACFTDWKYSREKKCVAIKSNGNTVCFVWANKRDVRLTVSQGTNVTDKAQNAIAGMPEAMRELFSERKCYKVLNATEQLENEYSFFYDEIIEVIKAYTASFDSVMTAKQEKKKSVAKRSDTVTYSDIAEYAKTHSQEELLQFIAEHSAK